MVTRAVFLDRDGVINRAIVINGKPFAPRDIEDFEILPGAEAAIKILADAGFLIFVVTNQPDIGNGLVKRESVDEMHELLSHLPIREIFVCPHKQSDGCECRKPRTGMLTAAEAKYGVDLSSSFMVGDRYSDMLAGWKAGCNCCFIDHGYIESPQLISAPRFSNLAKVAESILPLNALV
tara:strand:- start:9 stop:545 length:537 start_codon:yes stop_codon:yes gene_type:complete